MNTRHERTAWLKGLLALLLVFAGSASGCSSAHGPGNVLAGQACDSFSIDSDPACACCSNHAGSCVSGVSACAPKGASATCGDPCPRGLSCQEANDRAVCGAAKPACAGPAEQACGTCGSQTRSCQSGVWSSWSDCQSAACKTGETRACTVGEQTCLDGCSWSACPETQCTPGQTATQACGKCGSASATCQSDGTWSTPGTCSGEGPCLIGESQACGAGKMQSCTSSCTWGTCLAVECSAGQTDAQACGFCGMQTRSCVNGRWSAFSACSGAGECDPDTTKDCGGGGKQTCSNACTWGACAGQTCVGSYVQSCGVCGIQTRTCSDGTWSAFSECVGERDCIPGSSQACAGGMQSCNFMCYWDTCK
ncbi:MAG TPA: hypothetical protein VGL19_06045 [Polyangiaceae bacterium]